MTAPVGIDGSDGVGSGVRVRGGATSEDVAAVVAALLARTGRDEPAPNGYARWRATRRRALRAAPGVTDRPT